jgi:Protein of unknown function (DUF4239)
LAQVPTVLLGGLFISLTVLIAVAGAILVQRRVPLEIRKAHNAPLALTIGGINITFGVIVGFSAFLVLNKHEVAQHTVEREAAAVDAIYALAEQFPEPKRDQIQGLAASYANVVVEEEWPLMSQGSMSPRADALADELRNSIQEFEPDTGGERARYGYALRLAGQLTRERDLRETEIGRELPTLLWIALVSLATSMIAVSCLAGMENRLLHLLAVSVLAGGLAWVLFTIGMIDRPFGTGLRVGPEPFESVLHKIEGKDP